jgi:hypothetical protein
MVIAATASTTMLPDVAMQPDRSVSVASRSQALTHPAAALQVSANSPCTARPSASKAPAVTDAHNLRDTSSTGADLLEARSASQCVLVSTGT